MREAGIPQFGFNPLSVLGDAPDPADEARREWEESVAELDAAIAWIFSTPQGLRMKEWLLQVRRQPTFDPALGFRDGAAFGFFREGQNDILRQIEAAVERHHNQGADDGT